MTVKTEKEKKICDINNLMETFGRYQMIEYTLICLPALFTTMININYVFVAGDMNYRCRIDECEDPNSTSQFPSWWPDTNIDRCSKPVLRLGEEVCTNNSFTKELATCDRWIYESNNTVVAALDLACQPWRTNLIGTFHSLGMLVSMAVFGFMTDKFGRKATLIFCVLGGTIGNLKTLATSYNMYIAIEFLEAAVTGGTYTAATVLLIEITGKRHRLLAGVIFAYAIYLGETLFACIAMFVPYWKTLIHIICGPCIFFIVFIFLINESPRWQIVSGRIEKAKIVMKKIAKVNKLNIDNEELANIDEATLRKKFNIDQPLIKEGLVYIFTSKEIMKRLAVAGMCRFTSSFVYYGIMINSVWLPGDKYVNFLLSTVMSFPGELLSLYLMNKFGRKIPLMVGYTTCGVLCIISALIPTTYLWAKLALFLVGKVIISACYTGAITYTMELFPTSVRGFLLGLAAFASRIGGMVAPLTPIMNTVSESLPFIFFGCSAVLSGTLLILTPETKDLPLFDTIEQVINHRKDVLTKKNISNENCSMETVIST